MESVSTKYEKLKRWTKTIRDLEDQRSCLKATMNGYLHAQCLSVNTIIASVIEWQSQIHDVNTRLSNLHHLHNETWRNLKYEDQVKYRYWVHGEAYPNDESVLTAPKDAPKKEVKSKLKYFKIDRANAQKLCSKLIDFLTSEDKYFKVGFDETHSS